MKEKKDYTNESNPGYIIEDGEGLNDFDIKVVDIDENYSWKDEVDRLTKRNAYLEDEAKASQLMAALALKQHGSITVPKTAIAAGLPGWSLSIEDDGNDNIVIGVNPPDGV